MERHLVCLNQYLFLTSPFYLLLTPVLSFVYTLLIPIGYVPDIATDWFNEFEQLHSW